MVFEDEKYCIVSKTFPLNFYVDGCEYREFGAEVLFNKEECEAELATYDEPENCQIIKVKITYEF